MSAVISNVFMWLFETGKFWDFFSGELRSDFFNGFLSLAGFMLAAKTFIVIHMKNEVYDRPEYERQFDDRKKQVGESASRRYGPLERMSSSLYWIVVSSVVAAICQVTVGLIPSNLSACLCSLGVLWAIGTLIYGLVLIQKNLNRWFELVHQIEHQRENAQLQKEANGSKTET